MKRNMSYLQKRGDAYYIDFRMPAKWGGARVRRSLQTSDYIVAAKIRDSYILPVLAMDGATEALRAIAIQIAAFDKDAAVALSDETLARITGKETKELATWGRAAEGYCEWLGQASTFRSKTNTKYMAIAHYFAEMLGEDSPVYAVTREKCAAIRDEMVEQGKSATTISNYFVCVKGFLRWIGEHMAENSDAIAACFHVGLPTVRKKSTQCIPHDVADIAQNCLDGWTALPMILRYSGMRLNEAISCVRGVGKCCITEKEGIRCFFIADETCKTHIARYVPICDKLKSKMDSAGFLEEAARTTSADTKAYNKRIKKIAGCEEAHLHSWRVYANTEMMEAGVDENLRRRILGHTSKDSHFVYSAARMSAMLDALNRIG